MYVLEKYEGKVVAQAGLAWAQWSVSWKTVFNLDQVVSSRVLL